MRYTKRQLAKELKQTTTGGTYHFRTNIADELHKAKLMAQQFKNVEPIRETFDKALNEYRTDILKLSDLAFACEVYAKLMAQNADEYPNSEFAEVFKSAHNLFETLCKECENTVYIEPFTIEESAYFDKCTSLATTDPCLWDFHISEVYYEWYIDHVRERK